MLPGVAFSKGLAKLGNIVAETMFLFTFPGVAKLGNICFRPPSFLEGKFFSSFLNLS